MFVVSFNACHVCIVQLLSTFEIKRFEVLHGGEGVASPLLYNVLPRSSPFVFQNEIE